MVGIFERCWACCWVPGLRVGVEWRLKNLVVWVRWLVLLTWHKFLVVAPRSPLQLDHGFLYQGFGLIFLMSEDGREALSGGGDDPESEFVEFDGGEAEKVNGTTVLEKLSDTLMLKVFWLPFLVERSDSTVGIDVDGSSALV